jgi:hypothetical protein
MDAWKPLEERKRRKEGRGAVKASKLSTRVWEDAIQVHWILFKFFKRLKFSMLSPRMNECILDEIW